MAPIEPFTIRIAAPAAEVWNTIGPGFDRISDWAYSIPHSTADTTAPSTDGAPVSGRVCTAAVPTVPRVTEQLTAYDTEAMTLTYVATEGLPAFVASATTTWAVTAAGPHSATVTVAPTVEPKGRLGQALLAISWPAMGRMGRTNLRDLKHYIEHGEPSPRKRRSREVAERRRERRIRPRRQ